jgi:hydrophobic/amphiphilic exporter-1 (mainly G- bacteria), HAE1 family
VILEVEPQYQRIAGRALEALYPVVAGESLVPLDAVVSTSRTTGPLSINHFGQLPAVTISFNLRPGFSLGRRPSKWTNRHRELRMPATISTGFQGTVKEFQNSFRASDVC